jgi:hypothetical protein
VWLKPYTKREREIKNLFAWGGGKIQHGAASFHSSICLDNVDER